MAGKVAWDQFLKPYKGTLWPGSRWCGSGREQRPLWSADVQPSSPGSEGAMAESPTEEAATATAGAGAAGPGASGVAGVVGVSGSGGGFGPPFLPDVWAAAAAAGSRPRPLPTGPRCLATGTPHSAPTGTASEPRRSVYSGSSGISCPFIRSLLQECSLYLILLT